MAVVGRLKNGDLLLAGDINERLPVVVNGLVGHYPFDGTVNKYLPASVRYVRDWSNGNSINTFNHWVEIQVINEMGINVSQGKSTSAYLNGAFVGTGTALTNGSTAAADNTLPFASPGIGVAYQLLDLGEFHSISKITIWRYFTDGRTYRNTKTEVSEDGVTWHAVFDSAIEGEYAETSAGKTHDLYNLGITAVPSVNLNTVATYDGVAVEQSTTNLISADKHTFDAWTVYQGATVTVTQNISVPEWGTSEATRITASGGTDIMKYFTTIVAPSVNGTSYVVSAWFKNIGIHDFRFKTQIGTTITIPPGGMQRAVIAGTGNGTSNLQFRFETVNLGETIDVIAYQPQAENKSFATAYLKTTRGNAELTLNTKLTAPYTIDFEVTPSSQNNYTIYAVNVFCANGNTADLLIWKRIDQNYYRVRFNNTADISLDPADIAQGVRTRITIACSATEVKLYVNGVYRTTVTTAMPAISFIQLHKYAATGTIGNSVYHYMSFYGRTLTDDEIARLGSGKFAVTQNGNVNGLKVIEKPIAPPDALYFQLSENSQEMYKRMSPNAETNVVYENGGVWVGRSTSNAVPNPTGKLGATAAGSYAPGWNAALHPTAIAVDSWSDGYNSGVEEANIGYHGQWVYEGIDGTSDPCMKFIDKNTAFGYPHRWMGTSIPLGTPASISWTVGTVITVSWYQRSDVAGKGASVGVYHMRVAEGTSGFESCQQTIYVAKVGQWERVSFSYTITSNWNLTSNCSVYVYGDRGAEGTLWVDNVQVEARPFLSPFMVGSRSTGELEYNLNRDYGLDWNAEWSIVYWKKPVGTTNNDQTGYSIEGLGAGTNTVGGGYLWWGKNNNLNSLYSSTPGAIVPATYFNQWHMVSLVKVGTTLTIKTWLPGATPATRTVALGTIASNYYVTQHGYDLKLGGYDNTVGCNTFTRDLIVAKRAFTDAEVTALANNQMTTGLKSLRVYGVLREDTVL